MNNLYFSTSNRSRHCSTNSGFESSISIDSAIDIQTPPPHLANAQTNAKANDEIVPNKDTSSVEKRFDSGDKVENELLPIKDPPKEETNASDMVYTLQAQDEQKNNPPSVNDNSIIDNSDEKTYTSGNNDPFMVH